MKTKKIENLWHDRMKEIFPSLNHQDQGRRKMIVAGLSFIDREGQANPRFSSYEEIFSLVTAGHKGADALTSTMRNAYPAATQADIDSAVANILRIKKAGWEAYEKEMVGESATPGFGDGRG